MRIRTAAEFVSMKPEVKDLTPIGTIAQVKGPVVDITCAALPPLHHALIS